MSLIQVARLCELLFGIMLTIYAAIIIEDKDFGIIMIGVALLLFRNPK